MKRILLSIAILMFLAAGIGGWLLYSLSEKAIQQIEESIIEFGELEQEMSTGGIKDKSAEAQPESPPVITPGSVKSKAGTDKSISDTPSTAPSKNTGNSIPAGESKDYSMEEAEIAKELKVKVPVSEKASLTKLILSKLTKKDISELKGMLSNGITSAEKQRAKEILYSRLSPEDINRIKEAYVKYTQQK